MGFFLARFFTSKLDKPGKKKAQHQPTAVVGLDHRVIATGFEPVTTCLEGRSSIQLSYATIYKKYKLQKKPTRCWLLSGWQDSNLRPPAPKAGAITGLRYTPNLIRYDLYFNISRNMRFFLFQLRRNNRASLNPCSKKKPLFF